MSNLGALDMALDDVISQNRTSNKRSNNNSRRGNSRSTGGGVNKNRSGGGVRSSPYNARPARNTPRNARPAVETRNTNTRNNNSLVVANLHFNVTEKDLYDLFGQIGQLKRAFLHIGPNGKSAGIADVVFVNGNDAEKARNTYNNVELDGRPMRITNASIVSAVAASLPSNNGRRGGNLRGGNNSTRDSRDRRDNNTRRSNTGKRENRPKPSQQDLDAEMDSYMGSANNEDVQMN
ncbi:hypothetical protein INT47_002932 [Mucor saturninus]|uniref:RRM domain-containing protein n=1 Tax=Mucor saturninus TaxID=64648 RepID=A0A8H7QP74_9FUNG|nr:hypothetical protein INT47_002932 [Mucor saturninus]